jgi:hypothetical protein
MVCWAEAVVFWPTFLRAVSNDFEFNYKNSHTNEINFIVQ